MWFPWEIVGCFQTKHKSKVLWVSNESGCYYRGWLQLENSVVSRRCNVRWHLSGAHGWSHQDYLDLKEKNNMHFTASFLSNYYVLRTASEDNRVCGKRFGLCQWWKNTQLVEATTQMKRIFREKSFCPFLFIIFRRERLKPQKNYNFVFKIGNDFAQPQILDEMKGKRT